MVGENANQIQAQNIVAGKLLSSVNVKGACVLNLCVNSQGDRIAITVSNNVINVFEANSQTADVTLKAHEKKITAIKFSSVDPALLFSSSLDGKIFIWDTRTKQVPVQQFIEDSDGGLKPFTYFDVNLDERLICAGTDLIREDSFLVFWDRRTSKNLGGYWNSHTDEITQVQFHPSNIAGMASASVDGLINVFDLNGSCEDDSLLYTLNCESCVNSIRWISEDCISCVTSIEEYQLWNVTESSPNISYSRENLSSTYQLGVDYMIDTLTLEEGSYLATGTNDGLVCLWNINSKGLTPTYSLQNGHSDTIRTISYNPKKKQILTGGEDGSLCYWRCIK